MKSSIFALLVFIISIGAGAQPVGMEVGQVLIINNSGVKTSGMQAHKDLMTEASTSWAKGQPNIAFAHFFADRGRENGGHIMVASIKTIDARKNFPRGSPFSGPKGEAVLSNPSSFSEYQ